MDQPGKHIGYQISNTNCIVTVYDIYEEKAHTIIGEIYIFFISNPIKHLNSEIPRWPFVLSTVF